MDEFPFWIVSPKGAEEPQKVDFEWIYPNKRFLHSVGLVFAVNSYRIYDDGTFSINGGVRLKVANTPIHDSEMVCVKRHSKSLAVGSNEEQTEEVSYLMGFQGKSEEGESAEIYAHVSPDGKEFSWVKER